MTKTAYEKLKDVLAVKNLLLKQLYHKPILDVDEVFTELILRDRIAPYLGDVFQFLRRALKDGRKILLEGQLGALKDPDFGIYPMVTSSSTLAGYSAVGAGLPLLHNRYYRGGKGVFQRGGRGAFVSEIFGDEAHQLRMRAGAPANSAPPPTPAPHGLVRLRRLAVRRSGAGRDTGGADGGGALGYLDEIPVCVRYEADGKVLRDFRPLRHCGAASRCLRLPGWGVRQGIKRYGDLPAECRNYIEFIESQLGVPITMVSVGPGRDELIYR